MSVMSIKVTPTVGEFSDVEPGMIFVIPFTIHNVSTSVRRVRFGPPKTNAFRLINTQQSIAPGMKQVVEVEFSSKEVKEVHDTLVIKTEEGEVVIPLHAWFPAPNVVCDPVIELGRVSMQHPVESKRFQMKNIGKRDGVFKFTEEVPMAGLSLVPPSGLVPAGKHLDVLVHYFPAETGQFRGTVALNVEGHAPRLIEVMAEVTESRVVVTSASTNEPLSRVSFGKVFFGQSKETGIVLRNFSEHTVSFTLRPLEETPASDNEEAATKNLLPIHCSPREGRILANGTAPVTIKFAPELSEAKRGWEHSSGAAEDLAKTWDIPFVVEIVETEQQINLGIAGKATPIRVSLSSSSFRFPDCSVNDHCDIVFTFSNDNPELPVTFSFSRIAHFKCEPARGTLGPNAEQSVLLTFQPNQLGSFRNTVYLTLNDGVKKMPISVSGSSVSIGPRKPTIGGIDKIEEDFARPLKLARNTSSAPAGGQASATALDERTSGGDYGEERTAPELLLMSEWHQKAEHNNLYNNFVTNSRHVREYNEKLKKGISVDTNPDDIGMVPGEGLDEPEPKLPIREDRLAWTAAAENAGAKGEGPALRKALRVDENKLVKKKFRKEPANLNEVRECKLELSPTDIQNIITPIKVLDFQQVNVYSTNTKSFFIFNGLKTHILVQIPFQREELALSSPQSQVVPPGQMAGFDIVFRSETVQTFQQAIYFTINETHKLKFVVFAEAVPIDIQLSATDLQFRFPETGCDSSVTLPLTLTNNGNSNAEFQWGFPQGDTNAFVFSPNAGFVPARGQTTVNVSYTPLLAANETASDASLKVKGSTSVKHVMLSGSVQASSCTWSVKDARVDFKKIPVGSVRSQIITIKNSGSNSTVFAFDMSSLAAGITVVPPRGRVAGGASEEVTLQLKAAISQSIKCQLSCNVRGMKQLLKAQVSAEAKVPDFTISEPIENDAGESLIDFGGVYVGSFELRRIQIQNNDDVVAYFLVDLSSYPQFSLYDQDKRAIESTATDSDEIPAGANGQVAIYKSKREDDDDAHDGRRGMVYRIGVTTHHAFTFYLAFAPKFVGAVEQFLLPMSLAGSELTCDALRPIVVCGEGKKPRLVMTPALVDFGSRVVVRDNTSKIPNRILVKLTNETDDDLQWDLESKPMPDSDSFRVEPLAGRLLAGQSSQIQFTFTPLQVKAYSARYQVFLDGNREVKYMDITSKGFGSNPCLTFDRKEIVLPPVPLDVVTKTTFYVSNDGYESLDLRYKIAGEGKLPVTLNFPDGQTITSNHNVLPVDVVFSSKKPITFTINIDFYDDAEGIFSIPVTCTADNSLLTTYSYVKSRDGSFTVAAEADKKPLMYKELEDANDKETPRAASRDSGSTSGQTTGAAEESNSGAFAMIDAVYKKTMTKRAVDRLRNWLNANLLPEPVDDLIATLQANQGRLASELIEMLFGKGPQLPAQQQQKGNNAKKEASSSSNSITEPLDTLLLFLKSYGGCVSEVRSEYLLKYEDYCKLGSEPTGKGASSATANSSNAATKILAPTKPQRMPEKKFVIRAMHAWVTTIFQILKVFYFSRVTWKSFRALPSTPVFQQCASTEKWNTLASEPSSTGSNLFSTAEGLLLKWLTIHSLAVFGKRDDKNKKVSDNSGRLTNFESDLRDCRAFAACLVTYIPPLAPRFDTSKENGFVGNPVTATDFEKNASLLLDSMREYGMDAKITGREFLEFGGRDNVLFAAYLYSALPQYVPKTTIKFKGKLLEKITKQIELTNPTKWPIDYIVTLDGSDEFKSTEQKMHLEPKATGLFSIYVTPRFSKKVEGRCMFLSAHGGTFSSATMIFSLETEIESDSAVKIVDNLETPIYEVLNTEVWVENPFQANGQYSVQIHQEYVKDANAKPYPEESSLSLFPEAFWSPVDTLAIKKNDKTKFQLQFLPCVRGQYRARVVFKDEKVGEFAYTFVGNGQPPKPYDSISLQTEAAVSVARELTVPFRNSALEKALLQKEERFKVFKGPRKTNQAKETHDDGKEIAYKLDFVNDAFVGPNPFYTGPKSFTLKSEGKDANDADGKRKLQKADKQQGQQFNINFVPKGPGSYNGFLILSSSWDIRVVAVEGKSRSPGIKAELEFNCPARQQITQEIPITNSSEKEWVIAAQLTGEYFSGPRELRIPSGRSKSYTLQFNPTWVCDSVGQLILRNNDTQERYTYTLRGKAEEPLAENTIPVECKARETRKITINVPNITFDEVTYAIETDLPFVSGDTKITVGKMEVGKYVLNLAPQISGKTTGSITFIAPNKQYLWFVLQLTVLRPPPEDTITINAEVRKGAVAEISISNPTKRMVDFTVRRRGDGLLGDDILTLEPQKSGLYQLAFAPARSGTSEGVISFNNDDIGEFWYKLVLVAKDAAPILLNLQCEIGKSTTAEVVLDNPLDAECVMSLSNSNDVNFTVSPQQLVMKPNGSLRATITYIPSAIQSGQEAIIRFTHGAAGMWECKCRGTGLPPTKMETVTCSAMVGRMASVSVTFRNPFPLPRKFIFSLKSDDPTVFSLMQKKQVSTLAPFQSVAIAASYSPSSIASHRASIVVQQVEQTDGELKWEFPLLGTAEAASSDPPSKLACKARKEVVQVLSFPLLGLGTDVDDEELSTELYFAKDAQYARAAANSLTVKRVDAAAHGGKLITLRDGSTAQAAYFQFGFSPLRPFSTAAEVLIKKASGGLWRFPILFDVTSPDCDDVIVMEAAVNAVATVSFQLYNVLPQASPFTAHFSAESPQEFSVVPVKGILPPIAGNIGETKASGQSMTVSFVSSQYGKTLVGYLVVDTEEMQWRYEVRGTLPKYQPPTNVTSKVSSRLRPEVEAAMKKANSKVDK